MIIPSLDIFPVGGLASSVITTVWVGVIVVAFFNLRFGWVLSGLVVPGYLVPLILVKPWVTVIILIESIVTYAIVILLSERLSNRGNWSSLFGRDRFFALLLVSVLVRLVFDVLLLPTIGAWVTETFHWQFDYRSNLRSFGLIIICLIANQFWKTGVIRGLYCLIVTTLITFVVVRYGLLIITNFTVSNLDFMYEDIAASVLASPKAYIILLTTAFLASRMNLKYGWDYNGILLPSLLALQWYQPSKILTSFVEAFVILIIGKLVLRTPLFTRVNMEGARQLLLFFNISFLYRIALGFLLPILLPSFKVTDGFGFGYLLATLLAMRMHDKDIIGRVTRATLQTSLSAVATASLIGFALFLLPDRFVSPRVERSEAQVPVMVEQETAFLPRLHDDRVALKQSLALPEIPQPLPREIEIFKTGLEHLQQYIKNKDQQELEAATFNFDRVRYRLHFLEDRYLYLTERPPSRGWGMYVLDADREKGLVLEVPRALDEQGTLEAATGLFARLQGRALAIAGSPRKANADGSADVLRYRHTFFHTFHRTFADGDVLQVRGESPEVRLALGATREEAQLPLPNSTNNVLWVNKRLPNGLVLANLKSMLRGIDINWTHLPVENLQRESTRRGFAELFVNQDARRYLLAQTLNTEGVLPYQVSDLRIDGFLQEWILTNKNSIAQRGTNFYQVPRLDELLFIDEEVLTPLLDVIENEYRENDWSERGIQILKVLDATAAAVGYRLLRYRHTSTNEDFLILTDFENTQEPKYWGTYVFRLGPSEDIVVQIPRPLYEVNSFEYGVALFARIKGKVLLVGGAHPDANTDGSADIVQLPNQQSMFTLVNQVVLRESGERPLLTVQSRAFGERLESPSPNVDAMISISSGAYREHQLSPLVSDLLTVLENDGLDYRFIDGSAPTAGYEVSSVPQVTYLDAVNNKEFVGLWLSREARAGYQQQTESRMATASFDALGLPSSNTDLISHLSSREISKSAHDIPQDLIQCIADYTEYLDVVALRRVQQEWPEYQMQRILDRDSRQYFLLLNDERGDVAMVANLSPRQPQQSVTTPVPLDDKLIRHFIDSRSGWLKFGPTT